jgi:GNAT superfamily N-acetyltransferase
MTLTTTSGARARSTALRVRPIRADDVGAAGRIAFDAFAGIADRHGFPRDFPDLDDALGLVAAFAEHPAIWGVVAELDGRVVGSNFLDERGEVRGVGPITVDPVVQAAGVGRRLMAAALERAVPAGSVRLLQDSFNTASLALYSSLGFRVVEQTVLLTGVPVSTGPSGVDVRPLHADDLDACAQLSTAVQGFQRLVELRDALGTPGLRPVVARRDGRVVAYATTLADFGLAHAVAETDDDLFALVVGSTGNDAAPASFLLPLHQHALLRRCITAGLRIVKPMTYMVAGSYRRPRGAWIPSVLY